MLLMNVGILELILNKNKTSRMRHCHTNNADFRPGNFQQRMRTSFQSRASRNDIINQQEMFVVIFLGKSNIKNGVESVASVK